MPLTVTRSASGVVAAVLGEFTNNTVEELVDDLFGLLNFPEVKLDLTQLTEFDGSALQLLVVLMTEADRKRNKVRMDPVNPKVQECLGLLGFDRAIPALPEQRHGP
jgi:ABC-type transporter Mla MlaB component